MAASSLLLQLVIILALARLCGFVLRKLGQPSVVGEMAAGLLLGPVALGALFPETHAALFPPDGLEALHSLGSFGLALFMFVVGAEMRVPARRPGVVKASVCVAVLGIAVPAALGIGAGAALHAGFAPKGVGFWSFALFIGTALAVTAFPVLARILHDRGMTRSKVGQISLRAAAGVDVCAWLVLTLLIGIGTSPNGWLALARTAAGVGGLMLLTFCVLKPAHERLFKNTDVDAPSDALLGALLIGVFVCGWLAEWLGMHLAIGALLFGASLPRNARLLTTLVERVQPLAVVALLPIFFALAGLDASPVAFVGTNVLAVGLVLLAAITGKIVGAATGARVAGLGWRDSFAVGALMNARGVMELVVIRLGLDHGLIGVEIFTILFAVAIVTTAMATPLVTLCSSPTSMGLGSKGDELPSDLPSGSQ